MAVEKEIKTEKGTVVITISVPPSEYLPIFEDVKAEALTGTQISGFRKGKAPRELAEKNLNQDILYEKFVEKVIPLYYTKVIQEENLKPAILPRFTLIQLDRNFEKELVFEAKTCERPKIKIGNYRQELRKISPKTLFGPDGGPLEEKSAKGRSASGGKITVAQVLEKLREITAVEIPSILIEGETDRMLSELLNQVQSLGMKVEDYLSSQGKSKESLREEYQEIAEKTIKDEFILFEIGKMEGVSVSEKEIEEAIAATPDENARKTLATDQGKRYIEDVLRKRKTLELLLKIAEGAS